MELLLKNKVWHKSVDLQTAYIAILREELAGRGRPALGKKAYLT